MGTRDSQTIRITLVGGIVVVLILVLSTLWMGRTAQNDAVDAVRSVSMFYLDELAGRREQVVEANLDSNIGSMEAALELLTDEDLSDEEHLRDFQLRMRRLFDLEKFAFVDTEGTIYTADGVRDDIDQYSFDYTAITGPEISIKDLESQEKKVVIALPVDRRLGGRELVVCFAEMDMGRMLQGVSMRSNAEGATFCNIYTSEGIALSNVVLGGRASENNLLKAMESAQFGPGYSLQAMREDFLEGRSGIVSFTYNDVPETLSYVPVEGTDWILTYLIRESLISEEIAPVSDGIIMRSLIQSLLTVLAMVGMFSVLISQNRRSAQIALEQQTAAAESRVKQQELEHRLVLQEQLLEQTRHREQQEKLITALAADYWSVYYLDLDKNEGVCYQSHTDIDDGFVVGERFRYLEAVTSYANRYITDQYREEFLQFIQPDVILAGLARERVISYRYMVRRHGRESYEMVRFASVHNPGDDGHLLHTVGACFTDVDVETRRALEQSEALNDALRAAEEANKAKTAFLSNMSHEIRTPMNAIIGLDNIALHDEGISDQTRDYLEKIGGSAQHLLALINDILDVSRIESGRMTLKNEEFSFSKLLEQINTIFSGQCREKGLRYRCRVIGHVDDCYIGDNMKLRQILINILGNAVKFTPEGGSVEFFVERVARFDGRSTLQFTISDTGIGMSEEFLPHIFDTFAQEDSSTTNRYGSSGLGLAITKSIVEMMNGKIDVQSKKGEGTTFVVSVTLLDSAGLTLCDEQDDLRPQDLSVLVIDDDPIACEHAKLVLEKVGIASETALSGEEAIEMVRVRHARRSAYNLILVDWKMPGMDGVETTRRIRSIVGDSSAIIILTAYKWDEVVEEAAEAGVDCFISKPLFAANVVEQFKDALRRKGSVAVNDKKAVDLAGRRVLLAEDVDINAEIIATILQMRGMDVEHAGNGKIAVDMFAQHPQGYYDVVLMDMRMPEMDGLTATQTIRAMDRSDAKAIPIIALTANAFDEDVQRSLQAGLNAHLSKPVDPDNLFKTMEGLIGG